MSQEDPASPSPSGVATSGTAPTGTAPPPSGGGRFRPPDTYVLIFFVVLAAVALTWIVPAGVYDTREVTYTDAEGESRSRTVLVPGSFRYAGEAADDGGAPLFSEGGDGAVGLANYVFEGLVSGDKWGAAVGVVAFILVIGGSFGIVLRTGAVEAGILASIHRTRGAEGLILPVMFVLFSLGGAVFGMGEEAIAFAMILVPIVVALGYDSITGVLITYGATQIGFAASWMNPFSVAIAQGIAGVPVLSGAPLRVGVWVLFTAVGTGFTVLYGRRIRRHPERSLAHRSDDFFRRDLERVRDLSGGAGKPHFGAGHALVLLTILGVVVWVVWGVVERGYYIPEIAAQFFVMGVLAGIVGAAFRLGGMGINDVAEGFRDGAKDILDAALVVGMAKGIVLVLGGDAAGEPSVLNTLLHGAGAALGGLPAAVSAWSMFLFQSVFNVFVVSGSGQAALTMPVMAPLADLVGVTRQVAVLAFQLGDGLTNLIVPTSGALVGTLGVARLDWATWARFQWRFQLVLFALASLVVVAAALAGYR